MYARVAVSVSALLLLGGMAPLGAQAPRAAGVSAGFVVRIENVSRGTLRLPSGTMADIPLSPAVWAVHTGPNPILTPGTVQAGTGIEGLAGAGMAMAFAPVVEKRPGVRSAGFANAPMGGMQGGTTMARGEGGGGNMSRMLQPGQHYEFSITAQPGDRLSVALMLSQSNDGLVATGPAGIALFDGQGTPLRGDVTAHFALWDAGSEVNEEPGVGRNQGLRQGAPHAGDPERRPVRPMAEAEYGDRWPAVERILKVTITPAR